ncbi:hypothetical protein P7C70_g9468, partial [Phenoliferia sp. Uapishka_3]
MATRMSTRRPATTTSRSASTPTTATELAANVLCPCIAQAAVESDYHWDGTYEPGWESALALATQEASDPASSARLKRLMSHTITGLEPTFKAIDGAFQVAQIYFNSRPSVPGSKHRQHISNHISDEPEVLQIKEIWQQLVDRLALQAAPEVASVRRARPTGPPPPIQSTPFSTTPAPHTLAVPEQPIPPSHSSLVESNKATSSSNPIPTVPDKGLGVKVSTTPSKSASSITASPPLQPPHPGMFPSSKDITPSIPRPIHVSSCAPPLAAPSYTPSPQPPSPDSNLIPSVG